MDTWSEQELKALTNDFPTWIIWRARTPLDPVVTWVATRKRKPTTDEVCDGVHEYVACETAKDLRDELIDQAHLEAALYDLEHA